MAPMTTSSTRVFSVAGCVQQFGVQFLADQIHGRVAQDLFVGQHAEQFQSFALQTAPGEIGDVIHLFRQHLVEDDADDLDAFLFKQRLVERDFVNRFADAALGDDDDFAPRIFATCALDKSNTEPTPACPLPSHSTKSFSQATRSKAFWIFLTSASLFDAWRYLRVKSGSTAIGLMSTSGQFIRIHRVHQHGVLVNFLLLDFDKALADGLDVADAREMLLQRGDEAERRGGLAVVLARGGDENAGR